MDRQTMIQFGVQLRRLRKERKLSQHRLGTAVGVHYNRIGKYETGAAYPSVPVLMKLSEVLETSMDALLHGKTVAPDPPPAAAPAIDGSAASSGTATVVPVSSPDDARLSILLGKIGTLPPEDRHIVTALLEAFLSRRALSEIAALGH